MGPWGMGTPSRQLGLEWRMRLDGLRDPGQLQREGAGALSSPPSKPVLRGGRTPNRHGGTRAGAWGPHGLLTTPHGCLKYGTTAPLPKIHAFSREPGAQMYNLLSHRCPLSSGRAVPLRSNSQ